MRNDFVIDTNSNATTSLACWSTYATISHMIIKNCESSRKTVTPLVGDCQTNILVIRETLDHLIIYCHSPLPLTRYKYFFAQKSVDWKNVKWICIFLFHLICFLNSFNSLTPLVAFHNSPRKMLQIWALFNTYVGGISANFYCTWFHR